MVLNKTLYKCLNDIFRKKLQAFEIISVYHGLKSTCRIIASDYQLNELSDICRENNLSLAVQDYKIRGIADKGKSGFSNRELRLSLDDQRGSFLVYIAGNEKDAFLAREYDETNDWFNLGKIFGYPDCCIDFFLKNINKQPQNDLTGPACKKLSRFPFVNNRCLRYFGIVLLSHFVCDFDCTESKKMGESLLEIIRKYDLPLAEKYEYFLKSFVVYTEFDGVAYSSEFYFKDSAVFYKNIYGSRDSEILDLLQKTDSIQCLDYNKFIIRDRLYDNKGFVAMFE